MILPVISTDGLAPPPADGTLTNRLAALSELVLEIPSGGGRAEAVAGYKAFLAEFGCRVGPFDVLAEDKDAKVSLFSKSRMYTHAAVVVVGVPWHSRAWRRACLLVVMTRSRPETRLLQTGRVDSNLWPRACCMSRTTVRRWMVTCLKEDEGCVGVYR